MKAKGLIAFLALATLALALPGKAKAMPSARADSLLKDRIEYYAGSHYFSNRNYFGLSGKQYLLRFSIENGDSVSLKKDAIGFSYTLSPADSTDLYDNEILTAIIDTTKTDQEILTQTDDLLRQNIQGADGIMGEKPTDPKIKLEKIYFGPCPNNGNELKFKDLKNIFGESYNELGQLEQKIYIDSNGRVKFQEKLGEGIHFIKIQLNGKERLIKLPVIN